MKIFSNNHSKPLAVLLAVVMALSLFGTMACAAAAPTQDLPIVQVSKTQYTTFMSASTTSASLYATQTTDYTDNQPFTTAASAGAVTWGWTDDGSTIYSTAATADGQVTITTTGNVSTANYNGPTPDNPPAQAGYYAMAEIELVSGNIQPAVYSLQGQLGSGYPINFTIVIESETGADPVGKISVYVVDNSSGKPSVIVPTENGLTVTVPDRGDVIFGVPDSLQNDPSATGSLQALLDLTNPARIYDFSVNALDAHVIDLEDTNSIHYTESTGSPFYGWQYGVYRNNAGTYDIVGISTVVNPSVFPLQDGDKVYWQYGTYSTMPATWPGQ
jgi:hypothetical protein